jgi:hypothetical protein
MTTQEKALRDFAQFAAKLKGDEKSEDCIEPLLLNS